MDRRNDIIKTTSNHRCIEIFATLTTLAEYNTNFVKDEVLQATIQYDDYQFLQHCFLIIQLYHLHSFPDIGLLDWIYTHLSNIKIRKFHYQSEEYMQNLSLY